MIKRVMPVISVCATLALLATGCGGATKNDPSGRNIGLGIRVAAKTLPLRAKATVASSPGPTVVGGLSVLSEAYDLSPSGPLPESSTVTIPLRSPAPAGEAVVVATEETAAGPWNYIAGTLSNDRKSVNFTTTHFSIFSILGYDVSQLAGAFKTNFLNELDGGATNAVTRPDCSGQDQARSDGYSISSSTNNTVYWCFGTSAGNRVLKVVDNRRYPLEVTHQGLVVTDRGKIDYGQLSSLSHFGSGGYTMVAPGEQASFGINLTAGASGVVETQMDGFGQSLYALQTGVNTLLSILTRFGLGSDSNAIDKASKLLDDANCLAAIGHGPAAMLATCLSPKELLEAFGPAGVILVPLIVAGPIVAFFHSEWNALVDTFNGHDQYTIRITRSAAPAPTITTTTTAPAPASRDGFNNARQEWTQAKCAAAAFQGQYWNRAAADLKSGETQDGGDTSGYRTAASELTQLASIPLTDTTSEQQSEYVADAGNLDVFFNTPGLYVSFTGSC